MRRAIVITMGMAALIDCVLGGRLATAGEIAAGIADVETLPLEALGQLAVRTLEVAEALGSVGVPLARAIVARQSLAPAIYERAMSSIEEHWPDEIPALAITHAGHLPLDLIAEATIGCAAEVAEVFGERWERCGETRAALWSPELVTDPSFVDRALRVVHEDPRHACQVLGWNGSPRALDELVQILEQSDGLLAPAWQGTLRAALGPRFDHADALNRRIVPLLVPFLQQMPLPDARPESLPEIMLMGACTDLRRELRAFAAYDPHVIAVIERYWCIESGNPRMMEDDWE